MKNLFLLSAFLLVGATTLQAQSGLAFGAKGGVNFAKLTGEDVEDLDGRTAYHIGLVAELPISDVFSIQPELLYSAQGLQSEDDGFESTLKLDYINLPVLAKYYVVNGLSLEAGPQFGFLVNDEFEVEDNNGNTVDVDDLDFQTFDLSLAAGLGYEFNGGLFLQARYTIGFSNVDGSEDNETFEDDLTNSNLQLSVGYFFQ